MGSGLTLLFGVMRIVNLAHAVFMIVAAYIAFYAFDLFHIDPLLSVLITMPVMFLLGLAVYLPLFPRIEASPRYVEMTVLVTFALTLIIEGLLGFLFTGMVRGRSRDTPPMPSSSAASTSRWGNCWLWG